MTAVTDDPDRVSLCPAIERGERRDSDAHRQGTQWGRLASGCTGRPETARGLCVERTALKRYAGSAMVWAVSQDNRYLLIKEAFENVPWEQRSMIHLLSTDGTEEIAIDPKGQIHQLWFTKLPDHSVEFEYEHGGYQPGS